MFHFSCRKDSSQKLDIVQWRSPYRVQNFSILGCNHLQHFENQWNTLSGQHLLPWPASSISRKNNSCRRVKVVVNTQQIAAHYMRTATESKSTTSISSHPPATCTLNCGLVLLVAWQNLFLSNCWGCTCFTQCWWIWLTSIKLLLHLQVCFHSNSWAMNN